MGQMNFGKTGKKASVAGQNGGALRGHSKSTFRKLGALALMLSSAGAYAQTPAPAQQDAAREKALDTILAAEVPLGSDQWRHERFKQTPRRHEMIAIQQGGRRLQAFAIYPQNVAKAPVVMMIPEDQGLNIWARDMADQIAAMGVIVVVPDLLAGRGPNGGGRESFPDLRSVFAAHMALPRTAEPEMTADLNTWADYAKKMPQANGRLAVAGFAWGGGRAMHFALGRRDLAAAYVFYDAAPPPERLGDFNTPLYGFYAQNDPRVTRSLPATVAAMGEAKKTYEPVIYPGSDHMFMRLGEEPGDPNPGNAIARAQALVRLKQLIARLID